MGIALLKVGKPSALLPDEHLNEVWELWQAWNAYRQGKAAKIDPTAHSGVVPVQEIAERGYDLTARNPNRPEGRPLPSPMEIVASLAEREREITSIVEELDELLTGGNSDG